jgi:hypothetical protein
MESCQCVFFDHNRASVEVQRSSNFGQLLLCKERWQHSGIEEERVNKDGSCVLISAVGFMGM